MLNNRRKEKSQHLRKLSDKNEKLRKKNQGKEKKRIEVFDIQVQGK